MAQHDFNIADGSGAAVRADINNALRALAENSLGASQPATRFAGQWWFDSANNLLKIRNETNAGWITVGRLTATGFVPYTGTSEVGAATESARGIIEIATTAEAEAGTDDTRAMTPEKTRAAIAEFAPTATGGTTPTATTARRGTIEIATQTEVSGLSDTQRAVTPGRLPAASTTQRGLVELATNTEGRTGTDSTRAMTPAATREAITSAAAGGAVTTHLAVGSYAILINASTSAVNAGATRSGSLYAGGTLGGTVTARSTTFDASTYTLASGTWRAMGNRVSGRTQRTGTVPAITEYRWHSGLFVRVS